MASETTERAVRHNMPGYQGNQVSMVYLYSDQEKIGGIHDFDYQNVAIHEQEKRLTLYPKRP